MPRIAGVDIPENKRVLISLTYIYVIGKRKLDETFQTSPKAFLAASWQFLHVSLA